MNRAADGGSFRDPKGTVFHDGRRVLRQVSASASADAARFLASDTCAALMSERRLVGTTVAQPAGAGVGLVLEHERVELVSYPYEWSWSALRNAALLHLDLHRRALAGGWTMSDGSAYNVQFDATRPVFIDFLSFVPYEEGRPWQGHAQFCEQFIVPLVLQSALGVPFNAWYRGHLDGIPRRELRRVLPWWRKLSPDVLLNLVLPDRMVERAVRGGAKTQKVDGSRLARVSKRGLVAMLDRLAAWLEKLPPPRCETRWTQYETQHTYASAAHEAKRALIEARIAEARPRHLVDVGCNTGEYARLALKAGAARVTGLEADPMTAERAFSASRADRLAFLPLVFDACNPSPAHGWRLRERQPLASRLDADYMIALAVIHHLAIGRNIPLPQAVAELVSLAPRGVIEFVPKDDETVRLMLQHRDDVFPHYDRAHFEGALRDVARAEPFELPGSGRVLYVYGRH